jgi:hypothetical protein
MPRGFLSPSSLSSIAQRTTPALLSRDRTAEQGEERSPPELPRDRGASSSLTPASDALYAGYEHVGEFRER